MKNLPALLALTLVLAACGAGQTAAPITATPVTLPSQVISGTITSLSADHQVLSVAGQTLNLGAATQGLGTQSLNAHVSGAKVRINGDDANDLALSVGQRVTVKAQGDAVTEIDIKKEVRGVIESIDVVGSSLTITGQKVTVSAATRIELSRQESDAAAPAHGLADLKVGTFAEVTGTRGMDGVLAASSIEVRSSAERREQGQDDQSELHGTVSGLDATAKTFTALGTAVDYHLASVTGIPANGSQVEVKGTFDAASKILLASRIEVDEDGEYGHGDDLLVAGSAIKLEEKVVSLNAAARTLVAGDFTVDYAAAAVNGTPAVGAEARVVGKLDARDVHLVHATEIRFEKD